MEVAWTGFVFPFFNWALAVFWLAMQIAKPFVAIALAYALLGALTASATTAVSSLNVSSAVSNLSTLLFCAIPMVSQSPFCGNEAPSRTLGNQCNAFIDTQGQLEVFINLAYAKNMPLEILATKENAKSLSLKVLYSTLSQRKEISNELGRFVSKASHSSYRLRAFLAATSTAVEVILSMNKNTLVQLQRARDGRLSTSMRAFQRLLTVLPRPIAIGFAYDQRPSDATILSLYIRHVIVMHEYVEQLIARTDELGHIFEGLSRSLGKVARLVAADTSGLVNERDVLLSKLWMLSSSQKLLDKQRLEKDIELANRLERGLGRASGLVGHVRDKLIEMRTHIEGVRDSFQSARSDLTTSWAIEPSELEAHIRRIEGSINPLIEQHKAVQQAVAKDKDGSSVLSSLQAPHATTGLPYTVIHRLD